MTGLVWGGRSGGASFYKFIWKGAARIFYSASRCCGSRPQSCGQQYKHRYCTTRFPSLIFPRIPATSLSPFAYTAACMVRVASPLLPVVHVAPTYRVSVMNAAVNQWRTVLPLLPDFDQVSLTCDYLLVIRLKQLHLYNWVRGGMESHLCES